MQRLNKTPKYKVGFLLSAGGAAFARSVQMSGWVTDRFHVVADRDCGALSKAAELGIAHQKISAANRPEMSGEAAEAFSKAECNIVISHFSRLVGPELFERILTVNVHPSLLPAYPGLDGIGDAAKTNAPMQGATLHLVDVGMDTGPILAQTAYVTPYPSSLSWRHALGYRQKVVMTLVLLDWLDNNLIDPSKKGLSAFDISTLPARDVFCTPGFTSHKKTQSVATLFDDLEGLDL